MLIKHRFLYEALALAIDEHGNSEGFVGRQHFAALLGFGGKNPSIHLSGHLNYTTYNPATPKRINVDQLIVVLHELNEDRRRDVLEKMVNEYGYGLCKDDKKNIGDLNITAVFKIILDLDKRHGGLAEIVGESIADGHIDVEESGRIKAAAFELRKAAKALEELADGSK